MHSRGRYERFKLKDDVKDVRCFSSKKLKTNQLGGASIPGILYERELGKVQPYNIQANQRLIPNTVSSK